MSCESEADSGTKATSAYAYLAIRGRVTKPVFIFRLQFSYLRQAYWGTQDPQSGWPVSLKVLMPSQGTLL